MNIYTQNPYSQTKYKIQKTDAHPSNGTVTFIFLGQNTRTLVKLYICDPQEQQYGKF